MVTKTSKVKVQGAAAKAPGKVVAKFANPPDKMDADALAALALAPDAMAAMAIEPYAKTFGAVELGSLVLTLAEQMDQVKAGDMKQAEAMLHGQAQTLQAIFTNLARRAASQEYMKQWEAYLRMALKAQNQCRMTLETLATIKSPPVVIARQANINNGGQQQVNNGTPAEAPRAHAANPATGQTGLLEASDGERMDFRAAVAAGGADPHMAPVGTLDRAAHARGQGPHGAQR